MYLTHDILVLYEACQEGIEFFDRHFPDGVELADIIKMRHIPHSFLHWGWLHLTTTEEERALYNEVLGNKNSTGLYQSEQVTDSLSVISSQKINKSQFIYESKDVDNCYYVSKSENITDSKGISTSKQVFHSTDVLDSTNIKESQSIILSNFIIDSNSVVDSSLVARSSMIYHSKNINDCTFIERCNNLTHCLFCHDLDNKDYYIFNQPVDKTMFDFVYEELKLFKLPSITVTEQWEDTWNSAKTPIINRRKQLEQVCSNESFMKWVKTLPHYNPMDFYYITFDDKVLTDDETATIN